MGGEGLRTESEIVRTTLPGDPRRDSLGDVHGLEKCCTCTDAATDGGRGGGAGGELCGELAGRRAGRSTAGWPGWPAVWSRIVDSGKLSLQTLSEQERSSAERSATPSTSGVVFSAETPLQTLGVVVGGAGQAALKTDPRGERSAIFTAAAARATGAAPSLSCGRGDETTAA